MQERKRGKHTTYVCGMNSRKERERNIIRYSKRKGVKRRHNIRRNEKRRGHRVCKREREEKKEAIFVSNLDEGRQENDMQG